MKRLLLIFSFITFAALAAYQGGNPVIKPEVLLKSPADYYILDVRSPEEFADGHVPGAFNIPHYAIIDNITELKAKSDKDIVVYCRSGRRAWSAEQMMMKHGITNIQHLEGDMLEWQANKRPIAK
jgi:rhodanese-related sulfurtransferase